jgi:2-oxoglutarate dehydrogenase E2 component (dihydrolipoamide succinyltransferase)
MNNLETIVKLLDAGYTKAEIDAMLTPAAPAQEQTAPAQEQTAPEAPAEQTAPAQEQTAPAVPAAPAAPAAPAGSGDILEAINKLTQTIVMHNINTQGIAAQPQRTAEDALAEIIAPPGAQRNNLGR